MIHILAMHAMGMLLPGHDRYSISLTSLHKLHCVVLSSLGLILMRLDTHCVISTNFFYDSALNFLLSYRLRSEMLDCPTHSQVTLYLPDHGYRFWDKSEIK